MSRTIRIPPVTRPGRPTGSARRPGPARRNLPWVAAALSALLVGACEDGPSAPEPGRATVTLEAPQGRDEGAAVLRVMGGGIAAPAAAGGEVFMREGAGSTDLVVVLNTPGTITASFQVADLNALPSVEVLQVSGPSDDLRESLQGYSVKVTR